MSVCALQCLHADVENLPHGGRRTSKGKQGDGKRTRRVRDDEYDTEDSFLDDSELTAQKEELKKTRVETKHSGFYAHSAKQSIAVTWVLVDLLVRYYSRLYLCCQFLTLLMCPR